MQGARAAALQWLLLAVTAINDSRDGWSGSALPRVNKHTLQHIWQMLEGHHLRALGGRLRHPQRHTWRAHICTYRRSRVGCVFNARLL